MPDRMGLPPGADITVLLRQWKDGDEAARDELLSLVYRCLRGVAGAQMAGERPGHVLQPTALVHETYLRLADLEEIDWQDRTHFVSFAARLMRRVLVDHARRRDRLKRGGDRQRVTLTEQVESAGAPEVDMVDLDRALRRLEERDERKCRVLELRYFGGLTIEETAESLGVSPATVKRDWRFARAWLFRELDPDSPSEGGAWPR